MAGGGNTNFGSLAKIPGQVSSMTQQAQGQRPQAQGDNVFNQSAGAYSSGVGALQDSVQPGMVSQTMNQYMNPYQAQVVDDMVLRMRQRRGDDLNMVRGQAASAGAFGGARHGLVEAELMDRYAQTEDEGVARALQQGFLSSAQLGQSRIGQIQQGAGAMINAAPIGFNMGNQAIAGQNQAGMMQQQLNQQMLSQAGGQYDAYANYPQTSLNTALAGIQGNPLAGQKTQTNEYKPGLFDYLAFGSGMMGGGK